MTLLAVPFRIGPAAKDSAILNGLLALPVFPIPSNTDERRVYLASTLTDPRNRVWEVWSDSQLVGVLLLTRIQPRLDALAHFAFFDRRLTGRQALLKNVMAQAFLDLDLQRLSVEIPEHLDALIRYTEKKLGFKPEGQRQHAFWDAESGWRDVTCLRLLRSEFDATL
jgi:RimJ/RimL family protein N-acetyltransferase